MQKLESGSLPESADMLSDDLLEVVAGGTKSREQVEVQAEVRAEVHADRWWRWWWWR